MASIPDQVEAEYLDSQPFNAGDAKQVNAARKRAARLEKERLEVMEALLQNKKTRAWLWQFIEGCDANGTHIVRGDPYLTYFNWGQQNVGKKLLADAAQFPDLYILMANEARNRK